MLCRSGVIANMQSANCRPNRAANVKTIRTFVRMALKSTLSGLDAGVNKRIENYVLARKNVLISGGTGTCKTSLLNILVKFIPKDGRILLIDDSSEIQVERQILARLTCCFPKGSVRSFLLETKRVVRYGGVMKQKADVLQGTLALMVLKTLDVLGPLHGYGIARRIEQISGDLLAVNQGTLYPVLLKLEQEGAIASEWGASENNRRARFYRLTREGRKQLQVETQDWEQTAAIIARFFEVKAEDFS